MADFAAIIYAWDEVLHTYRINSISYGVFTALKFDIKGHRTSRLILKPFSSYYEGSSTWILESESSPEKI